MRPEPFIAAIRFGHGRRPWEPLPADPRAGLLAELENTATPRLTEAALPDLAAIGELIREDGETARQGQGRPHQARLVRAEISAALAETLTSAAPFRERLVQFWANHFTVARGKVPYFAGHFVREAIRPHVTGTFSDMVLAVVRHPAMIAYLDNQGSVGPNSHAVQGRPRGLNENLAREILELHTLTPAAGYTQADVTSFAKILTGWSIAPVNPPFGFVFRAAAHEPGAQNLMGQEFPEGEQGGIATLAWLAEHEATQRHLARKLATHFVADTPPPEAVAALFAVLRDTRGDLGAVARRLVTLDATWKPPLTKLRAPMDYVMAVLRALEAPAQIAEGLINTSQFLGQPVWNARAPNGWPDQMADWAAPEAMLRRLEWAYGQAGRGAGRDAAALAEAVMGPLIQPQTLQAAARAGSAREALTLVLTSPEFQRR
ncbi:MAG: DUF1800 family protein [Alphaproteobacteria bacterium]